MALLLRGRGRGEAKEGEGKERGRREGGKAEGKGREVPYFRLTLLATLVRPQLTECGHYYMGVTSRLLDVVPLLL